jgi:hypothetical protein
VPHFFCIAEANTSRKMRHCVVQRRPYKPEHGVRHYACLSMKGWREGGGEGGKRVNISYVQC